MPFYHAYNLLEVVAKILLILGVNWLLKGGAINWVVRTVILVVAMRLVRIAMRAIFRRKRKKVG